MNANDILLRADLARLEQQFERSRLRTDNLDDCWLWNRAGVAGSFRYPVFRVYRPGARYKAHRAAWVLAARQPIPDGMQVLHHCDVPMCVNPKHLFLGTHADNHADKMAKGRQARGERNNAKLTDEQVLAIRDDARWYREIAADYGLDKATVGIIKRGLGWKHVGGILQPNKRRGNGHFRAILDEDKVRQIRASGGDTLVLAERYGVARRTIYGVLNRETWQHVE